MGMLTRSHYTETAIWLGIVVIFFGYSFEFNQPIEIYKFGATGWPRVVLGLLLVITLGNLLHCYKHGSSVQQGRVGIADDDEGLTFTDRASLIKVIAMLGTPFLFALSLKPVGIYFGAPFFIALVIYLFGERRWKPILAVTALIYGILLLLFLVILNAPLPQGNMSPFYDYSAFILTMNTKLQQLNLW